MVLKLLIQWIKFKNLKLTFNFFYQYIAGCFVTFVFVYKHNKLEKLNKQSVN